VRSLTDLENLCAQIEALPSVMELHRAGLTLEDMLPETAFKDLPADKQRLKFEFSVTPPWALDKCVEAAVVWMDKNKAAYPALVSLRPRCGCCKRRLRRPRPRRKRLLPQRAEHPPRPPRGRSRPPDDRTVRSQSVRSARGGVEHGVAASPIPVHDRCGSARPAR